MELTTDWNIQGYEIRQRIASGGMGEVFLAVRKQDALPVVVKVTSQAADQKTIERLIKEHRLLLSIDHRHVVKLLDHGCVDDRHYLVLEYIEGRSLREFMRPGQPLASKQVASVLTQLNAALSALHAQNILHRDVKPENVLLDDQGRLTLIDLSIGSELAELGELTSHGEFLGTVDYMAPEQRHRLHVDHRTDQYSLAAMAFEMLTGRCPLGQFQKPSDLNPRLGEAVDQVLLKGLETDADDRFRSVDEFTRALLATLQTSHKRQASANLKPAAAVAIMATVFVLAVRTIEKWDNPSDALVFDTPSQAEPSPAAVRQREWANRLGQPVETNNQVGMKLALVPPGQFLMGMSSEELQSKPEQLSRRLRLNAQLHERVEIEYPFWMSTHEVTISQFRRFVEATDYRTELERGIDPEGQAKPPAPSESVNWRSPGYEATENHPASCLTWNDAGAFCSWLSEQENTTYRLPTEAEWEYACRAGTETAWSFGDDLSQRHRYCWLCRPRRPTIPSAVGGNRLPNSFGLYDMHGNVSEWCQDVFQESSGQQESSSGDLLRVVRGGSCNANPWILRSGARMGTDPRSSIFLLGFRVVREVDNITGSHSNRTVKTARVLSRP